MEFVRWLGRLAAVGALLGVTAPGISWGQRPAEPPMFTQDIAPGSRPTADRVWDYATDMSALRRILDCPAIRTAEQRAAITRRINEMRTKFMADVADPYWRGRADALIAGQGIQDRLDVTLSAAARAGGTPAASQCAVATDIVVRILLR